MHDLHFQPQPTTFVYHLVLRIWRSKHGWFDEREGRYLFNPGGCPKKNFRRRGSTLFRATIPRYVEPPPPPLGSGHDGEQPLCPNYYFHRQNHEFSCLIGRHLSTSTLIHSVPRPVLDVHGHWFPSIYNSSTSWQAYYYGSTTSKALTMQLDFAPQQHCSM